MNQKMLAIAAAFVTAAALAGVFSTTTMAAYADESETETEQRLKQSNVGSGESTNDNCGQNLIDSAARTACAGFEPPMLGEEADPSSSHEDW
jgi:hypothetical protein